MLLTLSILAILIGPLVLQIFAYNRKLDSFLFSFVLFSVGGILLFDIGPILWQHIGFLLMPLLLLGFFGPSLIEISFRAAAKQTHNLALILGIVGLTIHSAIDGAALVTNDNSDFMPYAVILHRIIVGLSVWWLVLSVWGKAKTLIIFVLIIASTIVGYYANLYHMIDIQNTWLDYFQAFVSGTLLHVIIHRPHIDDDGHHHDHDHELKQDPNHKHSHGIVIKHKIYFCVGAICALAFLSFIRIYH